MPSSWGRLAAIAMLAAALAGPAAAQPASISGTIRSAATEAPIGRARIVASSPASDVPFAAISAADGTYSLSDLPAGAYTLTVSRTGFANEAYGRHRAASATPVAVSAGQRVTGIDVALTPSGSITGRVFDEDGAPFAGAIVSALESRADSGRHVLAEVTTTRTDDRGEFRIFALAPGRYYVSARDPAFANVGSPRGAVHYAPTYYPGTSLPDEARPLTVKADGDPPRAEFRLKLTPPSWVSGRVAAFDGRELTSAALVITPVETEGYPAMPGENVDWQPGGRFTISAVPPGRYVIRARGHTQGTAVSLFSRFSLVVNGEDLSQFTMTLRPGALLEGEVVFDATGDVTPPPVASLRVRAPLTDGSDSGDALTGTVQPDRRFAIRGLMDGEHQVVVEGLRPPWVVESVVLRGTDLTDGTLDAAEGRQFQGVRVTITDRAATLSGTVQTARGRPAADAPVLVFSVSPQFWVPTGRRMRLTWTDGDGRFSIYGLPAGRYFAIASSMVDEADLGRRDVLTTLAASAATFTIDGPASRPSIDLRLSTDPIAGRPR